MLRFSWATKPAQMVLFFFFFVISWLKHQSKYFCAVCSARTRSRFESVTLGVNNHYQLKLLKVCVFPLLPWLPKADFFFFF